MPRSDLGMVFIQLFPAPRGVKIAGFNIRSVVLNGLADQASSIP